MTRESIMKKHPVRKALAVAVLSAFCFSALIVPAQAASKVTLNSLLKSSGITFKLEWLKRTDGFLFGFTFKGSSSPAITIAPGFGQKLLVQVNGSDMIFQKDATGKWQVIQADGDLSVVLCYLNSVIDFITGLQTCQGSIPCLFQEILALVTQVTSCSGGTQEPDLSQYLN